MIRGYLFVADFANNRIQKFETPIVMKIEEALLAVEQAKKLEELTYEEESKDGEVQSNEQETVTDEPPVRDLTNPILVPPSRYNNRIYWKFHRCGHRGSNGHG